MAQLGILVVISPFPGIKSNAYTGLQFPKRNVIAGIWASPFPHSKPLSLPQHRYSRQC